MTSTSDLELPLKSDAVTAENDGHSKYQVAAMVRGRPRPPAAKRTPRDNSSTTSLGYLAEHSDHVVWKYIPEKPFMDEENFTNLMADFNTIKIYPQPEDLPDGDSVPDGDKVTQRLLELLRSAIWYAANDYKKAMRENKRLENQEKDLDSALSSAEGKNKSLQQELAKYKDSATKLSATQKNYQRNADRSEAAYTDLATKFSQKESAYEELNETNKSIRRQNYQLDANLRSAEAALSKKTESPVREPADIVIANDLRKRNSSLNDQLDLFSREKEELKKDLENEKTAHAKNKDKWETDLKDHQEERAGLLAQIQQLQKELEQKRVESTLKNRSNLDHLDHNALGTQYDINRSQALSVQSSRINRSSPPIKLPGEGPPILKRGVRNSKELHKRSVLFKTQDFKGNDFDKSPQDPQSGTRLWWREWFHPHWNPFPGSLDQLPPTPDGKPHGLARASDFRGIATLPENLRLMNPVYPKPGEPLEAPKLRLDAIPGHGQLQVSEDSTLTDTEDVGSFSDSLDSLFSGFGDHGLNTEIVSNPIDPSQVELSKSTTDESVEFEHGIQQSSPVQLDSKLPTQSLEDATQPMSPAQIAGSPLGEISGHAEQILSPKSMDQEQQGQVFEAPPILPKERTMSPPAQTWPKIVLDERQRSKSLFEETAKAREAERRHSIDDFYNRLINTPRMQDSQRSDAAIRDTQPEVVKLTPDKISTSGEPSTNMTRRRTITFDKGTKQPKELASPRIARKNLSAQQWPSIDALRQGLMIICVMLVLAFILFCLAARGAWRERGLWLQANDITDAQKNYLAAAEKLWEYKHSLRGNDYLGSFLTSQSLDIKRGYLG